MTTSTHDLPRAEALQQAFSQIKEGAAILSEYRYDPRVLVVLAELEGQAEGWFHLTTEEPDYLIDRLIDLILEARGTPVTDHWRGHPMTREEAETIVGKNEE